MAALRSRLSLLTGIGGAPSVTTRAGFSATSRALASALGDLRVSVRAFPPGQSPRNFHSSRNSCSVQLPGDSSVPSHGVPSVSFGAPIYRCHDGCLQYGLLRYMQRAGSLGVLDRPSTALAHQLPRVAGSATSLAAAWPLLLG